jgi:hypothetical protein
MKKQLFWGELLTIMLEGFMELVISGYLEHSNPLNTSSGEAKA